MTVQEIMTKTIVTVELDDKLELVKEIFDSRKFHHLLVIEEKELWGVVSDRDLLKALSPNLGTKSETYQDAATLNKRVHQIMTRKPITLFPDAPIRAAADMFMAHNISCIPIVDYQNKPVGIVTWRDLLKALVARDKSA